MIFVFGKPHKVGSVCRFPCEQCGDEPEHPERSEMIGEGKAVVDVRTALLIRRPATRAEYLSQPGTEPTHQLVVQGHFYEVSTD